MPDLLEREKATAQGHGVITSLSSEMTLSSLFLCTL